MNKYFFVHVDNQNLVQFELRLEITVWSFLIYQSITQSNVHFLFFGCSGGSSAAKIASSKTFFKPFCVNAEHSTYLTALSSRANFSADSTAMGFCLFLASFSIVPASSRKSTWVPTSRNGVFGQWWVISGTHWNEKQTEIRWHLKQCQTVTKTDL